MTIHLSIILFWPLALALVGAAAPEKTARWFGFVGSLVPLAYGAVMLFDYDRRIGGLQYVTNDHWIRELGIRYSLGVDGLNLYLIALTTLTFAAATLWVALRPMERPKLFAFHLALAETAVLGAFMAQDLLMFVLFFDLMLVPYYFLTGQWGGAKRVEATLKLVIYTLVGSLLMLAAAVATGVLSQRNGAPLSFAFSDLQANLMSSGNQRWVFGAFALAFLIKMPSFPVHGWMPDGYCAMPLPALATFSGVLSKVAAYGFLRVVLPIFPEASLHFQTVILIICLCSIIYGSAMAFTTTEARLVLGYSSVAQLGFITLGIFSLQDQGAQGSILQMVNHGLVVVPVFLIVALMSERAGGSEDIRDMGGIAFRGPALTAIFLICSLATLAIPGSANFVGEFLILLGVFKAKLAIAIIASTGVALASVYMLRAFIRMMHNRVGPKVESSDLSFKDAVVLVPLVLLILVFGLYPQDALTSSDKSTSSAIATARGLDNANEALASNGSPLTPVATGGAPAPAVATPSAVPADPNAPATETPGAVSQPSTGSSAVAPGTPQIPQSTEEDSEPPDTTTIAPDGSQIVVPSATPADTGGAEALTDATPEGTP